METPRVLSIAEAAETLKCSKPTLRRAIREGKIPVLVMGQRKKVIPIAGLNRYLESLGA